MGHRTVYELLDGRPEDVLPLGVNDFMIYDDLIEDGYGFLGPIADSVSDSNRKQDFDELIELLLACEDESSICKDGNANGYSKHLSWMYNEAQGDEAIIVFKHGYKHLYFQEKFNRFKNAIAELDFDGFMSPDMSSRIFGPLQYLGEKFGDYVYNRSKLLLTLDDFIRELPDEDTTIWLGGTADYHY